MKIKTYKLLNSVGNEWCKINEENAKKIYHTYLLNNNNHPSCCNF